MAAEKQGGGSGYRFRVSDVVTVPLRGQLLRLRLLDGRPDFKDLRRGGRLRLRAPDGAQLIIAIRDLAVVGGRQTAERLERTRELDVIVSETETALGDGRVVDIGWQAEGPVRD